MSEWHITLETIENVRPHPNADRLECADVLGYTVVVGKGEYKNGDRCIFIPPDSIVPDTAQFSFLNGKRRVKATKIRGVVSRGLVIPYVDNLDYNGDLGSQLGIEKFDRETTENRGYQRFVDTENEEDQPFFPKYTDIESIFRWPRIIEPGEKVILTEKVHGSNARFCYKDGRLWVGSHNKIKKEDDRNIWWQLAKKYDLTSRLRHYPGFVFYAEAYGDVQELKYGRESKELDLIFFDVRYPMYPSRGVSNEQAGHFMDFYRSLFVVQEDLGLPHVPHVQYNWGWNKDAWEDVATGITQLTDSAGRDVDQIREGVVIRLPKERYVEGLGRVIFKLVSADYLNNRKDFTEAQKLKRQGLRESVN
jgi:RNA ligase (TIGR02306 family)